MERSGGGGKRNGRGRGHWQGDMEIEEWGFGGEGDLRVGDPVGGRYDHLVTRAAKSHHALQQRLLRPVRADNLGTRMERIEEKRGALSGEEDSWRGER